jgi:hypothetical protein
LLALVLAGFLEVAADFEPEAGLVVAVAPWEGLAGAVFFTGVELDAAPLSAGLCDEPDATGDWPCAEDNEPPTSAHETVAVSKHNFKPDRTTLCLQR